MREDRGVVVAVHLDPRVAVIRRHNPEDEDDHGGNRDDSDYDYYYGVDPQFVLHIIMVKMGWMAMPYSYALLMYLYCANTK